MSHRVHKRTIALLSGLLALAFAGFASPAFAHDELLGADPAPDAVVDALPEQIELTFSGVLSVDPGATQVEVTDASGASLTDGDPVLDGVRLRQPLTGTAAGEITVLWRVVSSDGHPVSGEYAFTVSGDGAATPAPANSSSAAATPAPAAGAGFDPTLLIVIGGVLVVGAIVVVVATRRGRLDQD